MKIQSFFAGFLFFVVSAASAEGDKPASPSTEPAVIEMRPGIMPGDTIPTCAGSDPVAGYAFKPNCKETITRSGSISQMSYNSEGLRDKDYPANVKKGWRRLLLVGSSRIVGPGIAEAETPARRLEKYLRGSNKKLEVINASVEGYSTVNQVAKLQRWLDVYKPTHVVVPIEISSGLSTDLMYAPYLQETESSQEIHPRLLPWMKPFAALMGLHTDNYEEMRRILSWQSGLYRAYVLNYCRFFTRGSIKRTACVLDTTIKSIDLMRDMATKAEAKIIFITSGMMFTTNMNVSPAFDFEVLQKLNKFASNSSFPYAEVSQLLRKRKLPLQTVPPITSPEMFLKGDYHFNKEGADLYARNLALRLQGFLE